MSDFRLQDFLPYQLTELARAISAGFSREYRDRYGITVAEWRVVAHLSQQDEVSIREITQRVGMDKPKVSRAASRLEAGGYITKVVDEGDRRLLRLALTDKGREMIETLAPIARAYDAELRALLGEAEPVFRDAVATLADAAGRRPVA